MYSRISSRSALRNVAGAARATAPATTTRFTRFSSTMHDNDPVILETEKARNLAGTQYQTSTPHRKHAPGWNEHLASASEASVKADKDTGSPVDLQKTTVEYIQSRHSPDETNVLDQVDGPLSTAQSDEVLVRKIHEETTEVFKDGKRTETEDVVKTERGVLSTE
ncbi:hypothetical protein DFH08DRAFT_266992 [Mycena albidolilacea]|uniref:Uncharacterized protein n=1 Tax=Mycena albidolilacea TaxID=1033008 RepID=A0AAD7F405_9AGAR|nr:hypothetical protein DFH08DRAFT_266992 [Mycena albidolilacea]